MGSCPYITKEEFERRLILKHGEIYKYRWSNLPNSIFYYDKESYYSKDFNGGTEEIGIFTNETTHSMWKELEAEQNGN